MARKRISKKNKSSWRKHSCTKEVQQLEDNIQSLNTNSSLFEKFVLDSYAADETNSATSEPKRIARSKIDEPVIEPVTISKPSKPAKLNIKRLMRAHEHQQKSKPKKTKKPDFNVWSTKSQTPITEQKPSAAPIENPKTEWLTPQAKHVYERETGAGTGNGFHKKIPGTIRQKPSILPAVEKPHPGTSYNPSLKDHLDLLNIVDHKVRKIEQEKKRLDAKVMPIIRKVNTQKLQATLMNEMTEGLSIAVPAAAAAQNEPDSDSEYTAVNPPVVNRPKDAKKRKKQAERKKIAREKMLAFCERRKLNELKKLPKIESELIARETYLQQRAEIRRQKRKEKRLTAVKRLGPVKFVEPVPDYSRPQDLAGSLRSVHVDGAGLLSRQFLQLQKRNMVRPSRIQLKKMSKKKSFVRDDDKIPANEELKYL